MAIQTQFDPCDHPLERRACGGSGCLIMANMNPAHPDDDGLRLWPQLRSSCEFPWSGIDASFRRRA